MLIEAATRHGHAQKVRIQNLNRGTARSITSDFDMSGWNRVSWPRVTNRNGKPSLGVRKGWQCMGCGCLYKCLAEARLHKCGQVLQRSQSKDVRLKALRKSKTAIARLFKQRHPTCASLNLQDVLAMIDRIIDIVEGGTAV